MAKVERSCKRSLILQRMLKLLLKFDHPLTGENEVQLTVEEMMHLRMIAKVIKTGDGQAYKAVMEFAYPETKEPVVQFNIDPTTMDDDQLEHTIKQIKSLTEEPDAEENDSEGSPTTT